MNSIFQIFPERASTFAGKIDDLYTFFVVVTIILTVGILTVMGYFAVKYRRRHPDEQGVPNHGSLKLEILWTVLPLPIVLIMFFWGTKLFMDVARRPGDATPLYVVAKQWMWKIQHVDGRSEINELHVPVGTKFRLVMASEDVIHSFYIPAFRFKMDVVPGRLSSAWFQANREGVYHLFCAEYCGTSHSHMGGSVYVMSPADYEQWLSGVTVRETMAETGARLFNERACITCHGDVPDARGPSLRGVFGNPVLLENGRTVNVDEAYVRESILKPQEKLVKGFGGIMPTFAGQLSEEQILQLIAYIKTLKPIGGAEGKKP